RELQVVEAGKEVALRIVDRAGAVIGGETVPGRDMIPGSDHELLPSRRELEPTEQYRLATLEETVGGADDEGRDRDPRNVPNGRAELVEGPVVRLLGEGLQGRRQHHLVASQRRVGQRGTGKRGR